MNALITRSAFIELCNKLSAKHSLSTDFVDITRYGEKSVIWRDIATDTGIARLDLGCSGKETARGSVHLAEHKTDKGYIDWMHVSVEGKREDLISALEELIEKEAVECKYTAFPKFETQIPAEHNFLTLEEIVEFFKKNNLPLRQFDIDSRYLSNINAIAPYGCTCSSFAHWGCPRELRAPLACQPLWYMPTSWGDESQCIEVASIGRDFADKSEVPEINKAYGWGWERTSINGVPFGQYNTWTEQVYRKEIKCWFYKKYLQEMKGVDTYNSENVKLWTAHSLDEVQKMLDEVNAAGFKI